MIVSKEGDFINPKEKIIALGGGLKLDLSNVWQVLGRKVENFRSYLYFIKRKLEYIGKLL